MNLQLSSFSNNFIKIKVPLGHFNGGPIAEQVALPPRSPSKSKNRSNEFGRSEFARTNLNTHIDIDNKINIIRTKAPGINAER